MKADAKVYKGIEFVRLSSLNKEQAASIGESAFAKKTIKILCDNELLSDCLPYSYYLEWYHQFLKEGDFAPGVTTLKLALE
jgi:hypothetical protein